MRSSVFFSGERDGLLLKLFVAMDERRGAWLALLRRAPELQFFIAVNALGTSAMIFRLFQSFKAPLAFFPFWMPLIFVLLYGGAFFFMFLPAATATEDGRSTPSTRRPALELVLVLVYSVGFINLGTWLMQHDHDTGAHAVALTKLLEFITAAHNALFGWLVAYRPGIAGIYVFFAIPLAMMLLLGNHPRSLGFRWPAAPRWTLAAYGGLFLLTIIQNAVIRGPERAAFAGLAGLLGAGLPEELLYRGIIQTRLETLLGPLRAIAATSLLFGVVHLGSSDPLGPLFQLGNALGPKALIGLILGHCYYRTRSLWPGVLFHATLDVAFFARTL